MCLCKQGSYSHNATATVACLQQTLHLAVVCAVGLVKKKDKILTMDPAEITYDMVGKKLRDIVVSRGRRGTDKQEQVEMLEYLVTVSKGPAQKLEVLSQLVSSLFDLSPGISSFMKVGRKGSCPPDICAGRCL